MKLSDLKAGKHIVELRDGEKYFVLSSGGKRYLSSAIKSYPSLSLFSLDMMSCEGQDKDICKVYDVDFCDLRWDLSAVSAYSPRWDRGKGENRQKVGAKSNPDNGLNSDLLRPKQAAAYLNMHRITIHRLGERDPSFPLKIKLGNRLCYYRKSDLDTWLSSQGL